jgi:glutaredoxin
MRHNSVIRHRRNKSHSRKRRNKSHSRKRLSRKRRNKSSSRKRRNKSHSRKINILRINSRFSNISQPLLIYTKDGCNGCIKAKNICNEKGIKFKSFNRKDYEDKVNKNSNNYKYVPAIFDSKGKFIGGTPELERLTT